MKKFIKVSLIIAGVMFALGCLLAIISMMGGKHQLKVAIRENLAEAEIEDLDDVVEEFVYSAGGYVYELTDGDWGFVKRENADGLVVNGGSVTEKTAEAASSGSYQVPVSSVKSLSIELGAGELKIETKADSEDVIDLSFDGLGNCDYKVEDGTLYIEGFKGITIAGNTIRANEIIVRIPENMYFEEVDMEVGAGIVTIENCKVGELEAAIGAGEVTMEKLEVSELSAEIGAGQLDVADAVIQNADLDISMGECIFEGTISGDLEADCDMGNLELTLTGKESDHNYKVSCSAGNISVGGFEFSGLATSREIDNNAEGCFDINCNMGNIVVEFEE